MMRLLGGSGGRGGDVRFKLYLSLLWGSPAVRDGEHDTLWPATDWAQLLGLPHYATKGRHRIYESIDWLHDHGFIKKVPRPGMEPRLVILNDAGDGSPYSVPSADAETGARPPTGSSRRTGGSKGGSQH